MYNGLYHEFDKLIAEALQVSVDEYIQKIESISLWRATVIIDAATSDDEKQIEKVRRIWKKLK